MNETQLVKQILDYCKSQDLLFYRTQAGMIKTERGGMVKMGQAGTPDITGGVNGRYIAVECKVGKNKQTEPQKRFEQRAKKHNCEYWLIYSLEEFIEKLENFKRIMTV